MQSRYPHEPSETNLLPSTKVSWLFDELSDNNASDDGLSLSVSLGVNLRSDCYDAIIMHMMAHSTLSIRACALLNQYQLTIL